MSATRWEAVSGATSHASTGTACSGAACVTAMVAAGAVGGRRRASGGSAGLVGDVRRCGVGSGGGERRGRRGLGRVAGEAAPSPSSDPVESGSELPPADAGRPVSVPGLRRLRHGLTAWTALSVARPAPVLPLSTRARRRRMYAARAGEFHGAAPRDHPVGRGLATTPTPIPRCVAGDASARPALAWKIHEG